MRRCTVSAVHMGKEKSREYLNVCSLKIEHYFVSSTERESNFVMATAGNNVPELGGYDYEFVSKVPEVWECLVCHLALKDPVQIVGCGHRLCNICMESLWRYTISLVMIQVLSLKPRYSRCICLQT